MNGDLRASFEAVYPDGCVGPGEGELRGQCAMFAETVIKLQTPNGIIGLDLAAKKRMVEEHGLNVEELACNFLIGDVVIQDYDYIEDGINYGHVSVVAYGPDDEHLQYAECNFNGDLKVHYNRIVSKNDPHIIGVLRGTLNVPFVNP